MATTPTISTTDLMATMMMMRMTARMMAIVAGDFDRKEESQRMPDI